MIATTVQEVEAWLAIHEDQQQHTCLRIADWTPDGFEVVAILDKESKELVMLPNQVQPKGFPIPRGLYRHQNSGKFYFLIGFATNASDHEQTLVKYMNLEEGDFPAFKEWVTPLNNFKRKFHETPFLFKASTKDGFPAFDLLRN